MRRLPIVTTVFAGVFGLIGLLALPDAANAVAVSITNPSFEDDVLAEGAQPIGAGIISGWVDGNDTGLYNPILDPGGGFIDPIPDGDNVAFSNQAGISQVLTEIITANTIYTLTVDVGAWSNPNPNVFPDNPEIQLWNGTTTIQLGFEPVSTGVGEWTEHTLIVEIGDVHPALGDPLQIILAHGGLTCSTCFSQVWWDNIRLDASPANQETQIPEPGTLGLFAVGLAGLGVLARRRRSGLKN